MKKAFKGATIYTIENGVFENGTLIIEGGQIIDVGKDLDTTGCEIIDCSGKSITPGLIDPHSHVGLWEEGAGPGPANSDGNETTDSVVPYLRSMDAIFPLDLGFEDARKGGVTTMGITHGSANPIGGQICVVKSYGHVVDTMVIKQPAGVKMAMGENPKRVGVKVNRVPQTRMGVAYVIRKAFYDAIDYGKSLEEYHFKLNKEDSKSEDEREYVKAPNYDLGKEILLKILNGEIPIRCHSHRADDIKTAIRLSEEFGYRLIIDHATESHKIKDIIIEKNIPIVVGPLLTSRSKRELVDRTLETPGIMVNAGAMVSITTDAPVIPIQGLRDTLIMAVREGLSSDKALECVTLNPAKVLGVDERIGSLKAGKDADFLIFDGDPLDARSKVIETYIDGNSVYKDMR